METPSYPQHDASDEDFRATQEAVFIRCNALDSIGRSHLLDRIASEWPYITEDCLDEQEAASRRRRSWTETPAAPVVSPPVTGAAGSTPVEF